MQAIELNKENFQKTVNSNQPVLVDFWATWCGPCRMLAPTVESVAEKADGYKVGKVNVDEQEEIAVKYGIEVIPTLLVFKNGEVVDKSVGLVTEELIMGMLEKAKN